MRHLVAISVEFAGNGGASTTERTLLANSEAPFAWASLAQIYGLPGVPEWGEWFMGQLEEHNAVQPLLGLGCNPALIKGYKEQFLSLIGDGLRRGLIRLPAEGEPVSWPSFNLKQ